MPSPQAVTERLAVPFLKWAGGKSVIADRIISHLKPIPPAATYFEPFLGGGAVFFRLRPERAVLIDSNAALVRTYRVVKDRVERLVAELDSMPPPANRAAFEKRRDEFNDLLPAPLSKSLTSDDVARAALMIWLNHTCYNGLYRVNKEGRFNVPFGYYEHAFIFDPENLRAASRTLNQAGAELLIGDYAMVLQQARRGDVLYFDPPYQPPDEADDGFTDYTKEGFTIKDQTRLAAVVGQLLLRGCRPVVSNSDAMDIQELYLGNRLRASPTGRPEADLEALSIHLTSQELQVPRAINCNGSGRGRVVELLFYPKNRRTLHDLWETVVAEEGFELETQKTFEVTSRRVKSLTRQEPRLIAKMDTREQLPKLLLEKGYFVLPVSSNRYALVPGDGYHDLEASQMSAKVFHPTREVPVTVALKAGESAAIQTAMYIGEDYNDHDDRYDTQDREIPPPEFLARSDSNPGLPHHTRDSIYSLSL